jgi:tetratricopeptide (TPR) repeat protein
MPIRLGAVLILTSALLVVGCSSKKPIIEKSAALAGAERLEHRASGAYAKGDAIGAAKDFQTAMQVYESLAMTDAAAGVQLSLARIDSDEGRIKEALARVDSVLGFVQKASSESGSISASTALLAHGRAAALYLQQKNYAQADTALNVAERLCANACEATSALLTMRANGLLATGDVQGAKAKAAGALAQSQTANDKANALRSLAQANLALGLFAQASGDAEQALQIDQTQGHSLRVISDLNLLASIYAKSGNAEKSAAYAALSQAAVRARKQLISH